MIPDITDSCYACTKQDSRKNYARFWSQWVWRTMVVDPLQTLFDTKEVKTGRIVNLLLGDSKEAVIRSQQGSTASYW